MFSLNRRLASPLLQVEQAAFEAVRLLFGDSPPDGGVPRVHFQAADAVVAAPKLQNIADLFSKNSVVREFYLALKPQIRDGALYIEPHAILRYLDERLDIKPGDMSKLGVLIRNLAVCGQRDALDCIAKAMDKWFDTNPDIPVFRNFANAVAEKSVRSGLSALGLVLDRMTQPKNTPQDWVDGSCFKHYVGVVQLLLRYDHDYTQKLVCSLTIQSLMEGKTVTLSQAYRTAFGELCFLPMGAGTSVVHSLSGLKFLFDLGKKGPLQLVLPGPGIKLLEERGGKVAFSPQLQEVMSVLSPTNGSTITALEPLKSWRGVKLMVKLSSEYLNQLFPDDSLLQLKAGITAVLGERLATCLFDGTKNHGLEPKSVSVSDMDLLTFASSDTFSKMLRNRAPIVLLLSYILYHLCAEFKGTKKELSAQIESMFLMLRPGDHVILMGKDNFVLQRLYPGFIHRFKLVGDWPEALDPHYNKLIMPLPMVADKHLLSASLFVRK